MLLVFLGLTPPIPKKVAFFVGLSDNMGPVTDHTDIIFDRVITNIGKLCTLHVSMPYITFLN